MLEQKKQLVIFTLKLEFDDLSEKLKSQAQGDTLSLLKNLSMLYSNIWHRYLLSKEINDIRNSITISNNIQQSNKLFIEVLNPAIATRYFMPLPEKKDLASPSIVSFDEAEPYQRIILFYLDQFLTFSQPRDRSLYQRAYESLKYIFINIIDEKELVEAHDPVHPKYRKAINYQAFLLHLLLFSHNYNKQEYQLTKAKNFLAVCSKDIAILIYWARRLQLKEEYAKYKKMDELLLRLIASAK